MQRALVYWLSTAEQEVHFVDAIISAYDGVANVRREYRLQDGRMYFKTYVAAGMEDEFLEILQRLQQVGRVHDFKKGELDAPSPASRDGLDAG